MKLFFKILVLMSFNYFGYTQNTISCENIKKGIIDKNLYDTLKNGKILFRINTNKEEVYMIRNKMNDKHYYVTKTLMEKIRKSKCNDVVIEKLKRTGDKGAPKIIRD